MSTAGLSYEELQTRRKLLLEELAATQNGINQNAAVEGAIDIHHPERSPNWPRYDRSKNEYPKMMYHPIKLDPQREAQRLGVRRRNEANPNLAPLDLPVSIPLSIKVMSEAEEKQSLEDGYVRLPPQLATEEDAGSFDPLSNPELVGAASRTAQHPSPNKRK